VDRGAEPAGAGGNCGYRRGQSLHREIPSVASGMAEQV
jgi:hypothetical protein